MEGVSQSKYTDVREPGEPFLKGLQTLRDKLTLKVYHCARDKNIARIAKRCPENISSVVKVTQWFYLMTLLKFFSCPEQL